METRRAAQLAWRWAQQLRTFKSVPSKVDVVLVKEVEGVGSAGQSVKVNPGFARNFLLPKRLATPVPSITSLRRRDRLRAQAGAVPTATGESVKAAVQSVQQTAAQTGPEAVIQKLLSPLVLKRKADGLKLVVPLSREDLVDAVAKQLRVSMVPEVMDIGSEKLGEVGEFLVPLKIVDGQGERLQLEVHVAST